MMAGEGTAWQIPMSAKLNVPDIPGSLARGMDLEQKQIETADVQQQFQDQQNDKQVLTDYTKQGGDLYTPQGIDKAKEDLRGKVSFNTYGQIAKQADALKQHDIDMREKILKFNSDETKNFLDKNNAVLGALVPITESYKADAASQGEQEAQANFEKNKAAKLKELGAAKDSAGQPLFTPDQIQAFGQMDYKHLAAAVAVSKPYHDLAETRWKESQTSENEALSAKNKAIAARAANMPESDKLHLRELEALHAQGLISDDLYNRTKEGLLIKATGSAATGDNGLTEKGQAVLDRMVEQGNFPPGAFRSNKPSPLLVKTLNNLGEAGADPNSTKASYTADVASLRKIVPQYDAITSFEENTAQQGQILKDLAHKVDNTGVPVVERWIRAGRRQVEGDADVSEFNAQIELYSAEAAKILTNPNLSGQLSDTARAEVKAFLPKDATASQIDRVVNRLTNDFSIRKKSLEDQIEAINSRISGKTKVGGAPADKPHAKVPPDDQKTADSDAVKILQGEYADTKAKLDTERDPKKQGRLEGDMAALEREIKKAGGTVAPAAPAAAKVSDDDLIGKYLPKK
jgi:hypothetical protein